MISRTMLIVNIIGQVIIIGLAMISFLSNLGGDRMGHNMVMISLIFLFWIGIWQLCLGILEVIIHKNKMRKKYLILVAIFIGSLLLGIGISPWLPTVFDNQFFAYLAGFYFFGSTVTFISWYFRQTIIDFNQIEE